MAYMKGFVLSRSTPCPNLVKRYCMHTLLRRCPISVRTDVDARWNLLGSAERTKGMLVSVAAVLAAGKNKPGSGRLVINLTVRNTKKVHYLAVSSEFKAFMHKYNRTHAPSFRFIYEHPTVSLLEFKSKLAGVSLDGRDVRVDGPLGIQWKENVPFAPGLRLGRVDRVLIGTVAAMTLLQSNDGRQIIIFKVLLVIMHNLGSHCAQYVYHLCICVLAGTHARCHSPHWPASCSDRSSRARYASRLQVHRQSFHYTRGETRRRDRGGR